MKKCEVVIRKVNGKTVIHQEFKLNELGFDMGYKFWLDEDEEYIIELHNGVCRVFAESNDEDEEYIDDGTEDTRTPYEIHCFLLGITIQERNEEQDDDELFVDDGINTISALDKRNQKGGFRNRLDKTESFKEEGNNGTKKAVCWHCDDEQVGNDANPILALRSVARPSFSEDIRNFYSTSFEMIVLRKQKKKTGYEI